MATKTRSRGSNDWAATAYWSGGSLPASNDDVQVLEGTDSFNTGVNQAAVNLSSLLFDAGYGDLSTTIGAAGSPLRYDVNGTGAKLMRFAGSCAAMYMQGGTTGTIGTLEWFPRGGAGRLLISGATITNLTLQSGASTVNDDVAVTTMVVEGGDHVLRTHASNTPAITVTGGRQRIERDFSTLTLSGTAEVVLALPAGVTGGNVTQHGGRLVHEVGDVGTVTVFAGEYDRSRLQRAASAGALTLYSQAIERREKGVARVSFSGRTEVGRGPTVVG
jgi:hypothetical protein